MPRISAELRWRLATIVLILASGPFGCAGPPTGQLSEADQQAILQLAVTQALEQRQLPGLEILESSSPVVLLADRRWRTLDLSGLAQTIELDPEAIRKRAEETGAFLYLSIDCCEVRGTHRVQVEVRTRWADPAGLSRLKTSGGALLLWVGRSRSGWGVEKGLVVTS